MYEQGKPQRSETDRRAADVSEVHPLMNDDINDEYSRSSDDAEIGLVGGMASTPRPGPGNDNLDTTNHLIELYPINS